MKKNVLKFTGRTLCAASFFVLMSSAVFAHAPVQSQLMNNARSNNAMEIKLLEADADKILLKVKLQNPEGSNFTLFITDENNNELFSKEYSEKDLDISVTLMRSDNVDSYKIGVRSANKQLEHHYSIVPTVKYVPDVVISKQ